MSTSDEPTREEIVRQTTEMVKKYFNYDEGQLLMAFTNDEGEKEEASKALLNAIARPGDLSHDNWMNPYIIAIGKTQKEVGDLCGQSC